MIKSLSDSIVIVDDFPDIAEIIQHSFQNIGFTNVVIFNDPIRLIENVKTGLLPNVVITDFNMPGLNGCELLNQLSELVSNIDGIIITAEPTDARKFTQKYHIIQKNDSFAEEIINYLLRLIENRNSKPSDYSHREYQFSAIKKDNS